MIVGCTVGDARRGWPGTAAGIGGSATRCRGSIQGLANCTATEIVPAANIPQGCGKLQKMFKIAAQITQTIVPHTLRRAVRRGSACFHQRMTTNKKPK